jgi:hypothetical protein
MINSLQPSFEPLLPISKENYYLGQILFTIPVALAGWVLLGLVICFIASKRFTASGFKDILSVLGFSLYVPCLLVKWIPETSVAFFYPDAWAVGAQINPFWKWFRGTYVWVGFAWAFVFTAFAVRKAANASWLRSGIAALVGIFITMCFFAAFLR